MISMKRWQTAAVLVGLGVFPLVAAPPVGGPDAPAAPAASVHVARGLTVELTAGETAVTPGRSMLLGVVLRPDEGFHTYWRQPGLVGLTPTVEWSLPDGFEVGEKVGPMLWPEPQRGMMGAYGVWCLKREAALVTPVRVPDALDPAVTPQVTLKAKVVWMACSRTCHPGAAELSLTLPVRSAVPGAEPALSPAMALIAKTMEEQPITDERWSFAAVKRPGGAGFSLTLTPPPGQSVPEDAYFFGHQRLVDSNVEPVRHALPGGAVRLDLALVEEPDPMPDVLVGELWSAGGWAAQAQPKRRLLMVRAPLVREPDGQ